MNDRRRDHLEKQIQRLRGSLGSTGRAIAVSSAQSAATPSLAQTAYINDLLSKHAPHLGTTSRKFDSPMADDVTYSPEQCPSPGSPEHEGMRGLRDVYMSIVGALLWLAACTRPDITFATSVLARLVSNPARAHYEAMQRVLAYLQHTSDRPLMLRPDSGTGVLLYSDASWSDCFSTSGGIIYVHGCAVLWYSRRQRTVPHSTAEAEYIEASMAAREGEFLRPDPVRISVSQDGHGM